MPMRRLTPVTSALLGSCGEEGMRASVGLDRIDPDHPDPLGDALGGEVLLVDDGDDARRPKMLDRGGEAGARRLRREAVVPVLAAQRVTELDVLGRPEEGEAGVADQTSGCAL